MRKLLAKLPVQAQVLEAALHSVCDQGRWQDTVRIIQDKDSFDFALALEGKEDERKDG